MIKVKLTKSSTTSSFSSSLLTNLLQPASSKNCQLEIMASLRSLRVSASAIWKQNQIFGVLNFALFCCAFIKLTILTLCVNCMSGVM